MYYGNRNPYQVPDQRFFGLAFGVPLAGAFLGGLIGGGLGVAFLSRPMYGGYPMMGYPGMGMGYPGMGMGMGYPQGQPQGQGAGGYPYYY